LADKIDQFIVVAYKKAFLSSPGQFLWTWSSVVGRVTCMPHIPIAILGGCSIHERSLVGTGRTGFDGDVHDTRNCCLGFPRLAKLQTIHVIL